MSKVTVTFNADVNTWRQAEELVGRANREGGQLGIRDIELLGVVGAGNDGGGRHDRAAIDTALEAAQRTFNQTLGR